MNLRLRLDIHWSSVRSSSNPPGELPAQVTRMSIFPKRASVASTQRWTSAMTLMSPAIGTMACPVAAAICFAAVSSGSAVPAVMATSAPSCARCSATARPMPLLAPVTKATFPPSCRSNANPSRRLTASPVPTTRPPPAFHRQPDGHTLANRHAHTLANRRTHAGKDGWYIKYQAFNRASPRRVAGLGRHPPGSRGLAHGRRGGGRYRARGARRRRRALATLRPRTPPGRRSGKLHARGGGRWSRHARLRAPPMPLRTDTFAAGAGHATPAYAPRTPLRKTDTLAAADAGPHYAPTETDMPPTALATSGHYAGGGS